MRYIKRPIPVSVEFAVEDGVVDTLEGPIAYRAGDALMTGVKGERWPMPLTEFSERYLPAPGVSMYASGLYIKQPLPVNAVQMDASFSIELAGRGSLSGSAGDWLLTAADGDNWIVRDDVFRETYAPEPPPCGHDRG